MNNRTRLDEDGLVALRQQQRLNHRYHAKRRAAQKRSRHRAERYEQMYEDTIETRFNRVEANHRRNYPLTFTR